MQQELNRLQQELQRYRSSNVSESTSTNHQAEGITNQDLDQFFDNWAHDNGFSTLENQEVLENRELAYPCVSQNTYAAYSIGSLSYTAKVWYLFLLLYRLFR